MKNNKIDNTFNETDVLAYSRTKDQILALFR